MAVVAAAAACGSTGRAPLERPAQPPPRTTATTVVARSRPAPVKRETLEQRLSPAQLAGQRIVYAYAGLIPPPSLLHAIRAGEAAGVIFFGPNVSSVSQLRGVVRELQRAAASSPVHAPLLLMADQEGGQVRRLPGPPVLSEKQIGAAANPLALAQNAGAGAGHSLTGAGLNVNLAPVLDVYRRSGNFIDRYERSYSRDAATVARLGAAFVAAQQQTRVAATAKHFPGLGAAGAAQNTDAAPVALAIPLPTLRSVDELPYRSALGAGVKLVMASWATYPALDPRLPAGLSPAVIQDELRRRLGFRGVTITDAITAGSLRRFGGLGTRGVLAARAGADLILCAATLPAENSPSIGLAVLRALEHGGPRRARSEQAVARILALRQQSGSA